MQNFVESSGMKNFSKNALIFLFTVCINNSEIYVCIYGIYFIQGVYMHYLGRQICCAITLKITTTDVVSTLSDKKLDKMGAYQTA